MDPMLVLTVVLAVLVGVALGLLGGGGSVLTVPLLVVVAGQDPTTAIATSLLVVATTSAVGAVRHARAGTVRWRVALLFGGAGMVGAYGGGRVGALLPGTVLLLAFAGLLVVTAVTMLRPGRRAGGPSTDGTCATAASRTPRTGAAVVHGAGVGAVTGLVGAGGGFLVVPALIELGGLSVHAAVGTSLVVIAMKSTAGLAGYLGGASIDLALAGAVTAAASLGAVVGSGLGRRVPAAGLRTGFGWFVLVVGVGTLLGELPAAARLPGAAVALLLAPLVVRWTRRDRDVPSDRGAESGAARDDAAPGPPPSDRPTTAHRTTVLEEAS